MGSVSLQHTRVRRSTFRRLYGPATFRPQGLVTLSAAYSLRALAGFFSRRRRSWDSPFGAFSARKVSAAFPRRNTHLPFLPPVFPSRTSRVRPAQWAAASGVRPFRESLAPAAGLVRRPLVAPLGFTLLGLSDEGLAGLHPGSSHALRDHRPHDRRRPAPRSINRLSLRLIRPPELTSGVEETALSGFLHQCDPGHSNAPAPGLSLFTSCRFVHHCRPRQSLGAITRSSGDVLGSPSVPTNFSLFRLVRSVPQCIAVKA
jgi:hypothetical protein